MKVANKLQFGVNAVIAGQKVTSIKTNPQLIVNCTVGKFTITSPVSKALNIAVGENVMFLNNIIGIEQAIQAKVDDIVAYAQEHNIDLDTREGEDAILKEFTQWFIAKGVPRYTTKGEPIFSTERMTKEDKEKYLAFHASEIVEANREALVEQFGDLSDEELISNLTIDMISYPKYHACSGSKTAANGNVTGVGSQLNFTDSAIWNALKVDLGDEANKKNRIFNVLLDEGTLTDYNDGCKNVQITIYPIVFDKDVNTIVRDKKSND